MEDQQLQDLGILKMSLHVGVNNADSQLAQLG